MKYINLCDNYFSSFSEPDKKKLIILTNNNLYLINPNNNNKYFERLFYQMKEFQFDWQFLSLSGAFTLNYNIIQKLNISEYNQMSLIKLDLSFCDLNTNAISNILNKNLCLFNLKSLNLKGNHIDESFFKVLYEFSLNYISLKKIKKIYLNNNDINDCDFSYLKNIVKNYKYLIKIILTKNPFNNKYKLLESQGNIICRNRKNFEDFIYFIDEINSINKKKVMVKFDTINENNVNVNDKFKEIINIDDN